MANYVTLAEVKNYLKINSTEHDGRLANLITYGCSVIESYCGRVFSSNSYTEIFDGGTSSLFVKNIPVNNVHQVLEYDGRQYQVLDGPTIDSSIVDASRVNKTVTSNTGFSLQTRFVKYGISSGQLNGSGGYLSLTDDDDFWFDSLPFAVEGWFRFNTLVSSQTLFSQVEDSNNYWKFGFSNTQGLVFEAKQGGTQIAYVANGSVTGYTANQYVHVMFSRDENNGCRIFKGGSLVSPVVTVSNVFPNLSAPVEIGRQNLTDKQYFSGQLDEIRMSLNSYRANANFVPQTYTYSTDTNTTLLMHFNGSKDAITTYDSSLNREQYTWYGATGEITKHVGQDTGRETLSILGVKQFYNYTHGVKITYNGGYDTIPSDVKLVTLDYIKELHKGLENRAVSLQGESISSFEFTGGFAPHIRRVLDLYRIVM
jgi:hypothetical protein